MIGKFIEPFAVDADQQRVLTTFVGNLSGSDLTAFVHIVTGSSSMMSKDITILFQEWHDDLSATPAVVNFNFRHATPPTLSSVKSFTNVWEMHAV